MSREGVSSCDCLGEKAEMRQGNLSGVSRLPFFEEQ